MATATDGKLIVANTTNVKEMKNGRPMNVKIGEAGLPNCTIVKLGTRGTGENDHVYEVEVIDAIAENELEHGLIYVVVAPEIMVEEARRTDGHIGKFRFDEGGVYTAYQLSKFDRLELSADHPQVGLGTEISRRNMAEAIYLLEEPAAPVVMVKVEF